MKLFQKLHIFESITVLLQIIISVCVVLSCAKPSWFDQLPKITDSMAGVFLQVDATILTLHIAIISIVSGVIDKSYMGHSITEFLFNKRPMFFKQGLVILFSIIFLFISFISYWFGKYYSVVGMLACEILLINISTICIYSLFSGYDDLFSEIRVYSLNNQTNIDNKKKKYVQEQNRFAFSFTEVIKRGEVLKFEIYQDILLQVIESLWNRSKEITSHDFNSIKNLIEQYKEVISSGIETDSLTSKKLSLRLLNSICDKLYILIRKEEISDNINLPKCRFNIIEPVEFYIKGLTKLDIDSLQENINLLSMLYKIQFIDFAFSENKTEWIPDREIVSLYNFTGYYIKDRLGGGNIDVSYWEYEYYLLRKVESEPIDENIRNSFNEAMTIDGINFVCSLLKNGLCEIVLPLYDIIGGFSKCNTILKKIAITTHAYLFYITCYETIEYIDFQLLEKLKNFVGNPSVSGAFMKFLRKNRKDVDDLLVKNLRKQFIYFSEDMGKRCEVSESNWINKTLIKFDFRINRRGCHNLILPGCIDYFCLFSSLYIEYMDQNCLDWVVDEYHEIIQFASFISAQEKDETELNLNIFIQYIYADWLKNENSTSKDYHSRIKKLRNEYRIMSERLDDAIRNNYKKIIVKEAFAKQKVFLEEKNKVEKYKKELCCKIYNAIQNSFGEIIDVNAYSSVKKKTVNLLNFSTSTDLLFSLDDTDIHYIVSDLTDYLIKELAGIGVLEYKRRKIDFENDLKYLHFILDHKLKWMIGSRMLLQNREFEESQHFNSATSDFKWIDVACTNFAMAIREESARFYISNLKVVIENESVENYVENGQYIYIPMQGIKLIFDKNEFSDYINNERKIISVIADIGMKTVSEKDEKIGIYFCADDF